MLFKERYTSLNVSLGLVTGVFNSRLKFTTAGNHQLTFLDYTKFKSDMSFSAGLILSAEDFFGLSKNIRFNFQVDYQNQSHYTDNIHFKLESIRIPIYINYSFGDRRITPFISGGLSYTNWNNTYIDTNSELITDILTSTMGSYQIGILGGFGLRYKNENRLSYQLMTMIEHGTGINHASSILISSTVTQFGVFFQINYYLTK